MTELEADVVLNLLGGIGPITRKKLRDACGSSAEVLSSSRSFLMSVEGIGSVLAEKIASWQTTINLQSELDLVERNGCHLITPESEEYPPLLREVPGAPFLLYVKGKILPEDQRSIAVVGSRLTTLYGRQVAGRLATELIQNGFTVVSGGADGIDTVSHRAALMAGGRTIVVFGNGLGVTYPVNNGKLFEEISQKGALISQFPFMRTGDRSTYPIRNRVVAGMTMGTVVVEANLVSGSLITAADAAEIGRSVFAVPGSIDSPRSKGCHKLIKEGAMLCESVEDILTDLETLPRLKVPQEEIIQPDLPMVKEAPEIPLTEDESRVMDLLRKEPHSVDEIAHLLKIEMSILLVIMPCLEMRNLVVCDRGKVYRLKR